MKLIDYLLLSASVGFFIIGVDQIIRGDRTQITSYYFIFMLSAACLLVVNLRKHQRQNQDPQDNTTKPKKSKNK